VRGLGSGHHGGDFSGRGLALLALFDRSRDLADTREIGIDHAPDTSTIGDIHSLYSILDARAQVLVLRV
jgi:hypothetical protein